MNRLVLDRKFAGFMIAAAMAVGSVGSVMAQSSLPQPGAGGSFNPAPSNGIGWNPGPGGPGGPGPGGPGPGGWGSPWGNPGWTSPSLMVNVNLGGNTQNSGVTNVVCCGYDAQGIWRTMPLRVSYQWNGVQYNVTVLNAWNPWTDRWNIGVDEPAYNTSYYLHGTTFNFYTVLSTGTYYFNL